MSKIVCKVLTKLKGKWKFQRNIEEIYTHICFLEGKIKKKNLVTRLKFICLIYIVTNVSTYFLNYYDIDYVL